MNAPPRTCALIPTYDNPLTIAGVVTEVRRHLADVLVVDDGSHDEARRVLDDIAGRALARVVRRDRNGGKGAAVKTGLRAARDLGFTHALQIDADGQHDTADIPKFLARAAERPQAAVLGHPVYDATMPRGRVAAHALTNFMVFIQTGGRVIVDPQCGFRVYPVGPALEAGAQGERMNFDIEIAVRLAWAGVPIVNVPTAVRYLPRAAGGTSHFRPVRDNVAITWMHTRLTFISVLRRLGLVRIRRLTA
jgi:glycosyltransferase involved in cell wall biosynthesis